MQIYGSDLIFGGDHDTPKCNSSLSRRFCAVVCFLLASRFAAYCAVSDERSWCFEEHSFLVSFRRRCALSVRWLKGDPDSSATHT